MGRKETSQAERLKRYRQHIKHYEPVYCEDCKEELFQVVSLEVRIPLGFRNLSKVGLISSCVNLRSILLFGIS